MILDHKYFNLYNKKIFEKAVLVPPHKVANPMPNEACFLYVLNGDYRVYSEIAQLHLQSDEGVLMKCGNYFAEYMKTLDDNHYEAIAVHFYPEILKKIYDSEIPDLIKKASTGMAMTITMSKVRKDGLLKKYIENLLFYFENADLVSDDLLILKLKELILLLIKTGSNNIIHLLSSLFSPRDYEFKEIVDAHHFSNLSIEEMAQLTNQSISSFKREFNRIYDDSPGRYIKKKKIEKATELLRFSSKQISEIAYECGFSDISHFSKSFHSHHEISPSQYRLSHSNK